MKETGRLFVCFLCVNLPGLRWSDNVGFHCDICYYSVFCAGVSLLITQTETCLLDVSEYEDQDLYRMQPRLAPAEPEYRDCERAGAGLSSLSCTSPDAVTL